jgi:NADPH:quinone reductase-like Zn-dependent oxidoreductase
MKAITQDRYGSPEVLSLRDIDEPAIGDDEVLVRVYAAGVDPGVWHVMTGLPYLVRLGFGLRRPRSSVRGSDVAGLIEKVGRSVTRFVPGDRVFGSGGGSYAELTAARADRLARIPDGVGFTEAAAVPVSGMTALQALRMGDIALGMGAAAQGKRVLIFGAGGGVGSMAVQLARAYGASVTGVSRPQKGDLVRSLGADTDVTGRYHVIVDTAGNRPLRALRAFLTPDGTAVLVGGEGAGGRLLAGFDRQLRASVVGRVRKPQVRPLMSLPRQADLETLADHLADGTLRPAIDRTFPLAETPAAIRHVATGAAAGKVVVIVTQG